MEVFSGYLTVKVPSILKNKSYDNYWCILYSGRGSLSPRVDLHQDKENLSHLTCKKTIYIEEAKWRPVGGREPAFGIDIRHSKHYIFTCQTYAKLKIWLLHLCCISKDLFDSRGLIGLDEIGAMNEYTLQSGEICVVQPNVLYGSARDACTFVVTADDTEGCHHYGLKGLYKLCVADKLVQLLNYEDSAEITCWSLHELRNFGHSNRTFFIHAGSRCKTGEGKFIFHTPQGEAIVSQLSNAAERIRQEERIQREKRAGDEPSSKSRSAPITPPKPKISVGSTGSQEVDTSDYENIRGETSRTISSEAPFGPLLRPTSSPTFNHKDSLHTGIRDGNIKKTLEDTLGQMNEQHLSVTRSASNHSAESDKKSPKESKKDKKKKEEEEKKERKRKEEEEKKAKKKKEEDKKREKDKKKQPKSLRGKPPQKYQENSQTQLDNLYASVDGPGYEKPEVKQEKIYSEPWGGLPNQPPVPMPSGNENHAVYAQPVKKHGENVPVLEPRDVVHTENYTPVASNHLAQQPVPPIIPPMMNSVEDDSNNNLYEHFSHSTAKPAAHENVYGMASASNPVSLPVEENPYEDTLESTVYERVG